MARPLRLIYAGLLHHLTARGNARQDLLLDDEDRRRSWVCWSVSSPAAISGCMPTA